MCSPNLMCLRLKWKKFFKYQINIINNVIGTTSSILCQQIWTEKGLKALKKKKSLNPVNIKVKKLELLADWPLECTQKFSTEFLSTNELFLTFPFWEQIK